jgi:pilus assembly protein CpaE
MQPTGAPRTDSERGQASVELLAVLPAALLIAVACWQIVLAGQAAWLAGNAARVAARAQAVGRDPERAATGALPSYLRQGLEVRQPATGPRRVNVRVRVPLLLPTGRDGVAISAAAGLGEQASP